MDLLGLWGKEVRYHSDILAQVILTALGKKMSWERPLLLEGVALVVGRAPLRLFGCRSRSRSPGGNIGQVAAADCWQECNTRVAPAVLSSSFKSRLLLIGHRGRKTLVRILINATDGRFTLRSGLKAMSWGPRPG